jgi:hypothetical protein
MIEPDPAEPKAAERASLGLDRSSDPPWPSGWPGPVRAQPAQALSGPRTLSRVLVRVTAALLGGSVLAMGVGVAPAVAREMGLSSVEVVHRPWARTTPVGRAGSDAVRSSESRRLPPAWALEELDEELPPGLAEPPRLESAKVGRRLQLRALPMPGASSVGELERGDAVMVLRAEGTQRLVVRTNPPPTIIGWLDAVDLEEP